MYAYTQESLIGTAIALPVLAIIAVALRFYARLGLRNVGVWVDDWLALVSVVLVCGHGVVQILGCVRGTQGRDDQIPDEARAAFQLRLTHAIFVIEKATYTMIKLSVLFLYRRIFRVDRSFRIANEILIGLVVVWGVSFSFLEGFLCEMNGRGQWCAPQQWALLWFSITDVVGDIAILSLPYPCIRKLLMSKREKIGVIGVFALGTLSTIVGLIRLGYIAEAFNAYFNPHDGPRFGSAPGFWTTLEVSTGVIAACLPPLRPLFRTLPGPTTLYASMRHSLSTATTSKRKGHGMEILDDTENSLGDKAFNMKSGSQKQSKAAKSVHLSG